MKEELRILLVRLLLSIWVLTPGGKTCGSLREVWYSRTVVLCYLDKSDPHFAYGRWVPVASPSYKGMDEGVFSVAYKHVRGLGSICAWGGAQHAHLYSVKDAWDLACHWSFGKFPR